MSRMIYAVLGLTLLTGGCATHPLHQAENVLGVAHVQSIKFSGTGRWFQFGQAPNPGLAWPPFNVSQYTADIDYDHSVYKAQIVRKQIVEPGRNRPQPVEQKVDQYLSGTTAWNSAPPNNTPAGTPPVLSAQPLSVEERQAEIVSTPHGFFRAAQENRAEVKPRADGSEVTFTVAGKYRYVGLIDQHHQLTQVQTWIESPVLGDTLIETRFSDYRDFGGIAFPAHIVRSEGGHPVLDLTVNQVTLNPAVQVSIPPEVLNLPPITVVSTPLAPGVYYLTGGTHHCVAIEQKDHVVLVEAPLHEARSTALLAKIDELIPGKPIRYVVNTHAHFDHSGGLRTFVDAGATVVTEQANADYYRKIWAYPHSLAPDRLSRSGRLPQFIAHDGHYLLTDGQRRIEIHSLAGNSHNDAFDLIYLPAEKIVIEADAYTPG
ncbi:MAG: MBL fold metallo-hydrolase, partial [Methylococcaceae bacterium]